MVNLILRYVTTPLPTGKIVNQHALGIGNKLSTTYITVNNGF